MNHISEDIATLRLTRLVAEVKKMRRYQADYYYYHVRSVKPKMLKAQRLVDEIIKQETSLLESIQLKIQLTDQFRVVIEKENN